MKHIIAWSGGKDSTATVILFKQHLCELINKGDEVIIVFAEVMFSHKHNISGHNPQIICFIHKAKKVFEDWGFTVKIVRSEEDFITLFHRIIKRKDAAPEHYLKKRGFPLPGKCWVKRDLKQKPINDFKKSLHEPCIEYVGIAEDEDERLVSLYTQKEMKISLLDRYGLTEADAKALCEQYGLLSPQYQLNEGKQRRDGCFFCPYAKECEHRAIYEENPLAWQMYVDLEDEENVAYDKWFVHAKETLHERSKRIVKI